MFYMKDKTIYILIIAVISVASFATSIYAVRTIEKYDKECELLNNTLFAVPCFEIKDSPILSTEGLI